MYIRGKKADSFRNRFWYYNYGRDIFSLYAHPSQAKIKAFEECRDKCANQNGYNFCILSYNTFGFTCAWMTIDDEKKTLHVETPYNSYEMEA